MSRRLAQKPMTLSAQLAWPLSLAIVAGALALPSVAQAQEWPADDEWNVLFCGLVVSYDRVDDEPNANDERDAVGNGSDPAAYYFSDADNLFFRIRLDESPLFDDDTFRPFGWGVEMSIDNDRRDYELILMVDGIDDPDVVVLSENTDQERNDPGDEPEVEVQRYSGETHARAVAAVGDFDSDFDGNGDTFVDVAVDWDDLIDQGVDTDSPIVLVLGTSSNAQALDGDIVCHDADEPLVITRVTTDPFRPDNDPVVDSDDDGLTDDEEIILGTDPDDEDSDGDGFSDLDEIRAGTDPNDPDDHPTVGTADSDGDGLTDEQEEDIGTDPNDPDSDNDGVSDADEVAAGTDPNDPNSFPAGVSLRGGPGNCSQGNGLVEPLALMLGLSLLSLVRRRRRI